MNDRDEHTRELEKRLERAEETIILLNILAKKMEKERDTFKNSLDVILLDTMMKKLENERGTVGAILEVN